MKKPYPVGKDTFSEMLLEKIIYGGSLKDDIWRLRDAAKKFIERASLARNAEKIQKLQLISQNIFKQEDMREAVSFLTKEMWSHYDVIHDDLFIMAAFENWAKGQLLSKKYMVHCIEKPEALKKAQKVKPIHFMTVRSNKYLPNLSVSHKTIGLELLTSKEYATILNLSSNELIMLERLRQIRNSIHFGGPNIYGMGSSIYLGLIELYQRLRHS